jgi:hypothetical protein
LAPRHLLEELGVLAEMVREKKKAHEREKEELRMKKKRKRASNPLQLDSLASSDPRKPRINYMTLALPILVLILLLLRILLLRQL